MTDEEMLDGPKVGAVAEAARTALGCRAVVIVAIGDRLARTGVAHPGLAIEDVLNCAAGSIHLAKTGDGGQQP